MIYISLDSLKKIGIWRFKKLLAEVLYVIENLTIESERTSSFNIVTIDYN